MKRILLALPLLLLGFVAAPTHAQVAIQSGDLVKSDANPAVYYFGADGKRYVFPTDRTYFTWYSNFSTVKTISTGQLANLPLGGNATYKPGVKMLKIQSDPRVYVVAKGGVLRAIASESVAAAIYGPTWNKQIDDIPDAFFVNYRVGQPIASAAGYDKSVFASGVPNINVDKRLSASPAGFIDIMATSGFAPVSTTVPRGTKVTWFSIDDSLPAVAADPHPTHESLPGLQSAELRLGETYSFTFSQAGTWTYHNHLAPTQKGTVVVQ